MGRQIGFFMTFTDELTFVSAVQKELGPLLIISNNSRNERETILRLQPADASNINLSLVRTIDFEDIVSMHIAAQEMFCVDLLTSKVVQFNRCRQINNWLAPGRLWFEPNTDLGNKSTDFQAWAKKILNWIKRNYKRSSDNYHFVGPEDQRLNTEGGIRLGPPS